MNIDLRSLRHLLALAEHKSFSRAAEAVHLTQSALSRSIQGLEQSVGAQLFERNRNAVEPTEMGYLLLKRAQILHAEMEVLEHEIRLTKGLEQGEIRIAAGPWGGASLVGPVIGHLNARHPHLRVRLLISPWKELPDRARAREVDIVVGELREIEQLGDFEFYPLTEHPTVIVGRKNHPLTLKTKVVLTDIFRYPLAGPRLPAETEHALQTIVNSRVADNACHKDILTLECDSSDVLRKILQNSDALSCMPTFLLHEDLEHGLLQIIPNISLGLNVSFGVAWLRGRSLGLATEQFLELLREYAQKLL